MQQPYQNVRVKLSWLLLFALLALLPVPNAAVAQDTTPPSAPLLYAGNIGWNGHWLLVVDAPTMKAVSWNALNDDVTYEIQFAIDASFNSIVLDVEDLSENRIEPNLPPDFYYFRIGATDSSSNAGPWSETGTLEVVSDGELPFAAIVSAISDGEVLAVELLISDDTVLSVAQFTINGDYAGSLGLRTEDYKIKPSFGMARIVDFQAELPNGNNSSLEVRASVSDVVDNIIYVPEPGAFPAVFGGLGFVALLGRRRASGAGSRRPAGRVRGPNASQEVDPRLGSTDAASKSEGFASQEVDPRLGSTRGPPLHDF